jgi:hypothetical protein
MDKFWLAHLHHFWAPALHVLVPDMNIYSKLPLRRLTSFFNQLRFAYAKFKPWLHDLVLRPEKFNRLAVQFKSHAKNLLYAFEFFLPAVINFK